jgi:cbb3-type cytochrome oxidase maturation protein
MNLIKIILRADLTHKGSALLKIVLLHKIADQMSVLFILIATSLTVALGFLLAFLWAVRKGQYEDDYTPSVRILFEEEITSNDQSTKKQS